MCGEGLTSGRGTCRDVDARLVRADLLPTRDKELEVRRVDEPGVEGVLFGAVQAAGRAEGHPRQVGVLTLAPSVASVVLMLMGLLCSLKCGGVGLNLVSANRVIK